MYHNIKTIVMGLQLIQDTEEFSDQLEKKITRGLVPSLLEELKKEFQPKKPEEYLTRDEVCSLLKISLPTLNRYTKEGKLKKYSLIGRVLYKRSEIENSLILLEQ